MCLINEIESHALLTHCYMWSCSSVSYRETIKAIKIVTGALDTAFELNKLIKYSMV